MKQKKKSIIMKQKMKSRYERNREETNCLHSDRLKNICNAVLPANCDKCYKKYLKSYLGCDICDINRCYNCFINYKTK